MEGLAKSVVVEFPHANEPKGNRTLYEQGYNTSHGLLAIPDKVCGEIWRRASKSEV